MSSKSNQNKSESIYILRSLNTLELYKLDIQQRSGGLKKGILVEGSVHNCA